MDHLASMSYQSLHLCNILSLKQRNSHHVQARRTSSTQPLQGQSVWRLAPLMLQEKPPPQLVPLLALTKKPGYFELPHAASKLEIITKLRDTTAGRFAASGRVR